MPRISESELERLKQDISLQRLAEARGVECVFRLMPARDSATSRPPIPCHAGWGFRGMSATRC